MPPRYDIPRQNVIYCLWGSAATIAPVIKLIAIDLDGTLLDPEERISARNREAIARVRAQGAEVVLVTARGFHRTRQFALELGLPLPVLCCGGALVADSGTGATLVHRPLAPEAALPILHFGLAHSLLILVHYDGHYLAHPATIAAYPEVAALVLPPWTPSERLDEPVGLGCTFLRVLGRASVDAVGAAFAAREAARLRFVELNWRGLPDLGIYDAAVTKGNTLRAFARERGILPGEIMAIGDNVSDASMFEVAGVKVAMANADDALKAVATYVTASNAADGVAQALDRYLPAPAYSASSHSLT